jgi:response regulator RpfG family c-di-GMP phosphodiesterase/serine/threonine protein kinase
MSTRVSRFESMNHLSSTTAEVSPSSGQVLLYDLLASSLILAEDWELLPIDVQEQILTGASPEGVLSMLVEHRLLTLYQAARISSGTTFGLVLGNYRVLDRLGAGGMAVVFKAEHIHLRHLVAIKVLPLSSGYDKRLLTRFFAEMRVVAQLRHPNIVAAVDAGKTTSSNPDDPELRYFVMDYVAGQDLEEYIQVRGPLPPAKACNLAHQIASALVETDRFKLVHRDIKPSNILITNEEQAKLLDFGLTRNFNARLTQPGTVLGTLDYMAPEQAHDASTVDIRADLYGLGGTLFWCLTGKLPFPPTGTPTETLIRRLSQSPPSARKYVPGLPPELDNLLMRLLATNPEDRYRTPQAVMQALLPFLKVDSAIYPNGVVLREGVGSNLQSRPSFAMPSGYYGGGIKSSAFDGPASASLKQQFRILLVDDEAALRGFCRQVLQTDDIECDEATDGAEALAAVAAQKYDLILLDIRMPVLPGVEVLRKLRQSPPYPHLKIIMCSGQTTSDEMAEMLLAGADDYLNKPFSMVQLQARVKAALRLKKAQDRSTALTSQLLSINADLEQNLGKSNNNLVQARNAIVLSLVKLVEQRDPECGGHVQRMNRYCRRLAEQAATTAPFASEINAEFIEMVACCAPLHDIGKVGLPDHILLKPGKLTAEERILMQAHTIIGSETLKQVAQKQGFGQDFLQMAIDITRHHHERFDSLGYPDRLGGRNIPLAARLVALADSYDALRSRRAYKPALSHLAAVQVMSEADLDHFDPDMLMAFQACASDLEQIFKDVPG